MKLYELERGAKLLLPIVYGIGRDKKVSKELCTFHRLDGAYSVIETPKGDTVHLSASTPLKKVSGHYELEEI